jgi:hypothetical protein
MVASIISESPLSTNAGSPTSPVRYHTSRERRSPTFSAARAMHALVTVSHARLQGLCAEFSLHAIAAADSRNGRPSHRRCVTHRSVDDSGSPKSHSNSILCGPRRNTLPRKSAGRRRHSACRRARIRRRTGRDRQDPQQTLCLRLRDAERVTWIGGRAA